MQGTYEEEDTAGHSLEISSLSVQSRDKVTSSRHALTEKRSLESTSSPMNIDDSEEQVRPVSHDAEIVILTSR